MVGSIHFNVRTPIIEYDVILTRQVSVLTGDSGTGKTLMLQLIDTNDHRGGNARSGIIVDSPVELVVIQGERDIYNIIKKDSACVYLFDEDICNILMSSTDDVKSARRYLKSLVEKSNAYFVFVSRELLRFVDYSVLSVFELYDVNGDSSKFVTKNTYGWYDNTPIDADFVITEDKGIGCLFYKSTLVNCEVISAGGKNNIVDKVYKSIDSGFCSIFVIADGAVFGRYMLALNDIKEANPDIELRLFLPESFEYVVLKSGIESAIDTDMIDNPIKYVDSEKYISYERYFTDLLKFCSEYSKGKKGLKYLKAKLLTEDGINAMYSAIKEINNYTNKVDFTTRG